MAQHTGAGDRWHSRCPRRDSECGETARASLGDIARWTSIARQTASRAVGKLVRRKMLQVLKRGGLNQGASEYRVFRFLLEK
jgi:hypothetical protein